MFEYTYIYDYVPTTASHATSREIADRNAVLDFLDGDLGSKLKQAVVDKVRKLKNGSDDTCVITFIPSWTQERTMDRYGRLASFLSANLDIEVYPDALTLKQDSDPVILKKEIVCNQYRVKGKNVILIGGVINSGKTFETVCSILSSGGAKSVNGLFIAKVKE